MRYLNTITHGFGEVSSFQTRSEVSIVIFIFKVHILIVHFNIKTT